MSLILNGRTTYSKSQENIFKNLSTFYLNDFLINFLMILSEATHELLVGQRRQNLLKIYFENL